MKLTMLFLFFLTAPFAVASEPPPLYGSWLAEQTRESEDQWLTRDTYALGIGPTGGPETFAYRTSTYETGYFRLM
jgi:hypothetical protein